METRHDDDSARAHAILADAGAETIDAAREEWWIGLRTAEAEHYRSLGGEFESVEEEYRRGYEAALRNGSGAARPIRKRATPTAAVTNAALRTISNTTGNSKSGVYTDRMSFPMCAPLSR